MLKKLILMLSIFITLHGCASGNDPNRSAPAADASVAVCAKGDPGLGQPNGCYLIGGKLTVKVSAPQIITAAITAPNIELFGVKAVFTGLSGMTDNFVLILPVSSLNLPPELHGTWTMSSKPNSKAYTIALTGLTELGGQTLNVKLSKQIFSGTVLRNGTLKGTINYAASIPKLASMSMTSNAYTGIPANPASAAAAAKQVVAVKVYSLEQFIGLLPQPLPQLLQGVANNNTLQP